MNRLTCLTLITLFVVTGVAAAGSYSVDENPAAVSSVNQYGDGLILIGWNLQFSFNLETASGANGNAGAEFDGTYFYSARWATNLIHQYDISGTLVKEFSIPGVSGLRDLAWDGTYMYGGASGSAIWEMDFISETLVSTINAPGVQCRAIAYNDGDDTFLVSNWADPVWAVDRTGAIVGSFNLVTTTSTYGFAMDNSDFPAESFFLVHDQTAGGSVIYRWDMIAGAFTGETHDVGADFPASAGIAGGLFFTTDFVSGTKTVGGVLQGTPDIMFAYVEIYDIHWWTMLNSFDVEAASGAAGNAGAEFDGTYYYSTRWASNLIHQYDFAGTLVKEFSIPGVSGLRDLAWDGQYMYGGAAGGTIWKMDFVSETLVGTITGGFQVRAIAYNDDHDTFICSNWDDPVDEVDRTGAIVDSWNLVTTTSTYGFAYDGECEMGEPCLWVFDQGSGAGFAQYIHQWNLTTGSFSGSPYPYDVTQDITGTDGIAGGLWASRDHTPGYMVIGGLLQGTPDHMFAYGYETGTPGEIHTEIVALNGTIFEPGEWIEYEVTLTNTGGTAVEVTARTYASGPADFDITLQGPITLTIQAGATIGPVSLDYRIPQAAPPIDAYICVEAIPTRGGSRASDCYLCSVGSAGETITGGLCPAFILQDPIMPPPLARITVASIWVCDADLDSIHHVSGDGEILASIPAPCGDPQALSIDAYGGDPISLGLYVSCIDNDYIYHVSTGGVVLDSFPAAGADPECLGLTEHTAFGWYYPEDSLATPYSEIITRVWTTHESELCLFDPITGSYSSTIPAPGPSASGLEWAISALGVSALWVCDNELDMIYKVSASDGEIVESFPSPGTNPTGIAAGLIIPDPAHSGDLWDAIVATLYESEDVDDTLYTVGAGSGDVLSSIYLPPSCEEDDEPVGLAESK